MDAFVQLLEQSLDQPFVSRLASAGNVSAAVAVEGDTDVLLDSNGNPILDSNGNYITDSDGT